MRTTSAFVFVLAAATPSWADIEVNTCGQSYSGPGHLAADLDCSAVAGDSVVISNGKLDLRGFTLTGNVLCPANCVVYSTGAPGRIVYEGYAIHGDPPDRTASVTVENVEMHGGGVWTTGSIRMSDSTITDCTEAGVLALDDFAELGGNARIERSSIQGCVGIGVITTGSLRISDSDVMSNGGAGVDADGRTKVERCNVGGNAAGVISFSTLKITDSTITANAGEGVRGAPDQAVLRLMRSEVSGNGGTGVFSLSGRSAKIADSIVSLNGGHGVDSNNNGPVHVSSSTISDNALSGIFQFANCGIKAKDSVLTGNGTSPDCGITDECGDIETCKLPNLRDTTCEHSVNNDFFSSSPTWGVCSLD